MKITQLGIVVVCALLSGTLVAMNGQEKKYDPFTAQSHLVNPNKFDFCRFKGDNDTDDESEEEYESNENSNITLEHMKTSNSEKPIDYNFQKVSASFDGLYLIDEDKKKIPGNKKITFNSKNGVIEDAHFGNCVSGAFGIMSKFLPKSEQEKKFNKLMETSTCNKFNPYQVYKGVYDLTWEKIKEGKGNDAQLKEINRRAAILGHKHRKSGFIAHIEKNQYLYGPAVLLGVVVAFDKYRNSKD